MSWTCVSGRRVTNTVACTRDTTNNMPPTSETPLKSDSRPIACSSLQERRTCGRPLEDGAEVVGMQAGTVVVGARLLTASNQGHGPDMWSGGRRGLSRLQDGGGY